MRNDIEFLLKKYSKKQPAERWSPESELKDLNLRILKQRIQLFEALNSEYFRLKDGQKDRVVYLIRKLNFNKVCPRCNEEQIIILICFYVKCEYIPNYERRRCNRAFVDYNITDNLVDKFMVYLARLGFEKAL